MEDASLSIFQTYYIHVFDVDIQHGLPEPVPSFVLDTIIPAVGHDYVPIAYIREEALEHYISEDTLSLLARRITSLLLNIQTHNHLRFDRFVLDFDWKKNNQAKYFEFLKLLRDRLAAEHIDLQVTLRLHQVRLVDSMAAPPVSSVLLMCYNMNAPDILPNTNSIYNARDFKTYAKFIPEYTLPMSFILPAYTQTVLFREQNFVGYIAGLDREAMEADREHFRHRQGRLYEVIARKQIRKVSLEVGDILKVEDSGPEEMNSIRNILNKLAIDSPIISIFDAKTYVNKTTIRNYVRENY